MFLKKWPFLLVMLVLTCVIASGCGKEPVKSSTPKATKGVELTISAAASMQDALNEVKDAYEKTSPNKLVINFGSSGTLETQIEQGAPVDLFLSAAEDNMKALSDKGLIDPTHETDLLKNDLVLIVPKTSSLSIKSLDDLKSDSVKKVGIGIPDSVPAGAYAKEALTNTKDWDAVQPKLVQGKDVRQVLDYVETGNVEAGIVYRTDALISSKVKIAATIPDSEHSPIVYPVGIIKDSKHAKAAQDFYKFLQTDQAGKIFEKYGFKLAKAK
ncbi:molybdate ABC transporter substrate-binding protein [Pullulanibacillus sp. KACC 23026]|uniref:molybdate ABC transporter substrate-binding protein n=1 Tax=Pullulanibacillus sp. KACC 23026 TaxID=3028315 RepID=UPI0023B06AF8|nr:molybdate ABC transporter substrate-binding protein [Pullulanibacillus sp. KACC 23026]WEG12374.1 molybdate ABC transporter substrate-binding protein [Pullulanibacillus sp. KACC 23026]